MPIDINGYNDTFRAFTDFAQAKVNAGQGKAIARAPVDVQTGALAGREIKAATTDSVRHMFKWFRSADNQKANDATREIFRNAIIDMFGGESKIPAAVKKAIIMADYDKGKPLTARRILAVKAAIDASGTTAARIENLKLAMFVEAAALAKGYSKAELPLLAKAVNLYAQATGCSEMDALEAVSTPNSKPNRLMNYGGRFLRNADNFKNGLRLIDSFDSWYNETCAAMDKIHVKDGPKYEPGMPLTLLNGRGDAFDLRYKLGTEKFVFEELAFNSSINLAEENPEQVFGMENNAAMRAIGRDFHSSRTQTFTQIPPEKRPTFLKALDTLCPLFASDAEKAKIRLDERPNIRSRNFGFLTARILKNFDKIAGLERSGKLTAANLAKLCFPEIKNPGPDPIKSVNRLFDRWYAERYGDTNEDGDWIDPKYPTKLAGTMQNIMEATGCTIEEAFEVANGSKMPSPNVQYYSPGSMSIESLDGTTNIARREVQGDINRPDNYMYKGGKHLLAETSFRFNLPGEEPIATNATPEGKANVTKVMDKLEALCGKTHVQQASSLLMMVSQSGLSVLRGGLDCYGIESSEHSSVDFTIAKNGETGDITIRYSSPKELPFHFEWTATIKPDGYVSTTPMKFAQPASLPNELKTAALDAGYSQAELPKLANATKFYAEAKGISEAEAFKEVSTPGTNANRLMNYGGRFLEYKEDFADGLRLMDSFSKWFGETGAELAEIHKDPFRPEYKEGQSKTIYNAKAPLFAARCKPSMERFTFEYFAHDPSVNLSETDPEKLFGIENNPAISTIGRNFSFSRTQTFAQVPPEKRTTLFKALNVLSPLYASNLKEANEPPSMRNVLKSSDLDVPVARILKNLDKVAELEAKGQLTSANLVKLCFPEITEPGENPEIDVMNFLEKVNSDINEGSYPVEYTVAMGEAMNSTGCSVEEAFQIAKGEKQIANVPYFSSGTMEIHQLGDLNASRSQLAGDLSRADNNYGFKGSPLTLKNPGFRFNFPGESIVAGKTAEGKANIPKITDKLESLCGKAHPQQAASLLMMASQSGLGIMKGGLMVYGVSSDEHSSMDFTISKNEETGDITIRYSAPEELPFHLEWTATIDVNGNVSTTPVVFNPEK